MIRLEYFLIFTVVATVILCVANVTASMFSVGNIIFISLCAGFVGIIHANDAYSLFAWRYFKVERSRKIVEEITANVKKRIVRIRNEMSRDKRELMEFEGYSKRVINGIEAFARDEYKIINFLHALKLLNNLKKVS